MRLIELKTEEAIVERREELGRHRLAMNSYGLFEELDERLVDALLFAEECLAKGCPLTAVHDAIQMIRESVQRAEFEIIGRLRPLHWHRRRWDRCATVETSEACARCRTHPGFLHIAGPRASIMECSTCCARCGAGRRIRRAAR